ncbi:MAG: 2-oxoglutarate ferredoxin oxidoreductase subunit alpha, partial [Gemmatimonadales bacterium]
HVRYIHPFPRNLGDLLRGFGKVLVPEMNNGQLVTVLRSTYLIPAEGLDKVNGKPFKSSEILDAIRSQLGAA